MDEEFKAIMKNDTWKLTTLPKWHKAIGAKWCTKFKKNRQTRDQKHTARLVAKGYRQKAGINHDEVFAHVARWETIRLIISLAVKKMLKTFQIDVIKSAFLNGFSKKKSTSNNH